MLGPEYKSFVWNRPSFTFVSTIRRQGRCVPSKTIIAPTLPFLLDSITVVYLQFNGNSNDLPSDVTFNSRFDSWESPFRKPQGDGQHSNSWPGHGMTSCRTRDSVRVLNFDCYCCCKDFLCVDGLWTGVIGENFSSNVLCLRTKWARSRDHICPTALLRQYSMTLPWRNKIKHFCR